MQNTNKIIFWISTGVMLAIFTFSATMYLTKYEMVKGFFQQLGFPTWIVMPLAIAKILGIIAILTRKSKMLTEWAYAGFFFDAALALAAHLTHNDGGQMMAIIALVALVVSRFFYGRLFPE